MSASLNATDLAPANMSAKLKAVRERRILARRKRYRRSKLDRYRAELVSLHRLGASYRDMAVYLRHEHRRRVDPTTVRRYLVKLPEVAQGAEHADISQAR
ncbi:MAG: hypothetical protein OXQ89_09015 [Rhodospirillaceae bacterium]|nr:hypothetical protein [Rhodospirillaceae bacterium]